MKKSSAQLNAEIAAALKHVSVKKLFAWRPKLEETLVDIAEGRLSHSPGKPLLGSHLDTPRGAWLILDGHHRMVEAMQAGRDTIEITLDQFVPRIERAGGAYSNYVDDKVNVYAFLLGRERARESR